MFHSQLQETHLDQENYEFCDLKPFTCYEVQVRCIPENKKDFWSEWSSSKPFCTCEAGRYSCGRSRNPCNQNRCSGTCPQQKSGCYILFQTLVCCIHTMHFETNKYTTERYNFEISVIYCRFPIFCWVCWVDIHCLWTARSASLYLLGFFFFICNHIMHSVPFSVVSYLYYLGEDLIGWLILIITWLFSDSFSSFGSSWCVAKRMCFWPPEWKSLVAVEGELDPVSYHIEFVLCGVIGQGRFFRARWEFG